MELEEEQNCYPGCIPEFGAIFMSNTRTKVECFRQQLFGLPSGQAPFVKKIKAGMVLFLFEFERRELHGVYQASTDGAMNIVPHAYSSSGMQFPAQVKVTHLWHCSPLSEDEFRAAIIENYYSAKKFNFGLSEDQVHKLLYLFSLKKLTRCKDARYSVDKFRRAADDRRSILSIQGEEADSSPGSVISTGHFDACLGNGGRTIDDGRFATRPGAHFDARLGNDGRAIDDGRFAARASSGVVGAAISTLYPGQFELASTFCRSMEPQSMNLSCSISTGDAMAVSCHPYDPDASGIESRHLSSYEHNSNPVQNFTSPHNSDAESLLPSSENQLFLPYTEPRGASCTDFSSVLGNGAPMASPNHYGNSQRTRRPFLEASYFENTAANPSENEGYRHSALSRPGPFPFTDSGNSEGTYGGTSYSFSPSHYPSFVFDYECREASQDNDQKMMQCGINLKEGKSQLQGPIYPVNFNHIDRHDNSSLEPGNAFENYGAMYSDCQKNRKSVFSRLALAPKEHIRECDTLVGVDEDRMDTSVDEVMSMLHQSRYQWLKIRKKGQLFNVDTTDFREKRQTTPYSKLLKDHFKKSQDGGRMNSIPASEENSEQFAEKTPFVDFKRRSELRKGHYSDSKIGGCGWSAETEGSACGLDKRRKLIRPNFSKNELIDTNIVETPEKVEQLQVLSHVSHADNNIEAERVSTCKQESVETCGATFSNLIEVGKELSQTIDIGTRPFSLSEEGLTNKDSVVNGLFHDLNSSTHSVQQESSLEACERSNNGIASGEIECFRNMQDSCPNAVLDGEVAVDIVNDSCNQTHKLERTSEEVLAGGCKVFKVDTQQDDDDGHAVVSNGCEIITGQCQTISSN